MAKYSLQIREEELKNKVAADWFEQFDTTQIVGNIDFSVALLMLKDALDLFDAEKIAFLPYDTDLQKQGTNKINLTAASARGLSSRCISGWNCRRSIWRKPWARTGKRSIMCGTAVQVRATCCTA